jgi:hypothetical protein
MNCFIHTRYHLLQTGEPGSEKAPCEECDIEKEKSSDQPMKRAGSWGSHDGLQPTNFVERTSFPLLGASRVFIKRVGPRVA